MDFFEIPEEVLLLMIHFVEKRDLQNLRITCKRLYDLTFEPCLWRHLEVNKCKMDSPFFLDMLNRVSRHVEHLSTRCGQHNNFRVLENKQVTFPVLRSIDLDLQSDNCDHVNSFLRRHPFIKEISLWGPLTDILSVVHALSNICDIKLRKLGLLCTDDNDGEDLEIRFDGLVEFVLHNNHLETLSILCDDLTDDAVQCFLSSKDIPLKYLSLNDCSRITQTAFSRMNSLATLVSLSLDNTNADDSTLEQIAVNCPMLQFLSVQDCALVTDVGFAQVAQHCGQLRDLIVNRLEMKTTAGRNITDHGLDSIAEGCTQLKSLLVNYCPGVSSTGLIKIAENCRDLEEISVAECLSVTDAAVIALAQYCPRLRKVNLNSCLQITSEAVNRLVITCKHLHSLSLETCRFMSKLNFDDLVVKIDNPGKEQEYTQNDRLDIVSNDHEETRDVKNEIINLQINDKENNQAFSKELNLGTASLVRQTKTDAIECDFHDPRNAFSSEFSDIYKKSTMPRTKQKGKLDSKEKPNAVVSRQNPSDVFMDDKGELSEGKEGRLDQVRGCRQTQRNVRDFHYISPQHSHLRVLHFGFSSSLTDDSVRQIGLHCPDLVDFSVRGCHSLSDSAIRFLLQRCRLIQKLDISGGSAVKATGLTDACLLTVAEYSSRIKKLFIMKNDLITTEAVTDVIQKCRHLDSVYVTCSKKSIITREAIETMTKMSARKVTLSMDSDINTKGALVIKCRD